MNYFNISPVVAERLKYYVYLYIDPRSDRIFYVGKGKGNRILDHLYEVGESEKNNLIRELLAEGLEPKLEFLVHGLDSELDALRIEAAVIDLVGKNKLTNAVRGWGSKVVGRSSLAELRALYDAAPADIDDAVLLIRINQLYRYGITAEELYEVTRGVWKISKRREGVRYAFAIFRGVVREVYCVDGWFPAGSTAYFTRSAEEVNVPERWEFVGHVAGQAVREKYIDKSVSSYLFSSSQNPLKYVNC